MTVRKAATRSSNTRRYHGERLKDEVYRQMFRLEAGRPGADMALAIALLHGWIAASSTPGLPESSDWLKKICPMCLSMIEAKQQASDICQQCV